MVILSPERISEIEAERERVKAANLPREKGTYKLMCPACTKPNSLAVDFCTGCAFPLVEYDAKRQSDNIFLDMINGIDIGCKVHHRGDRVLVFDDKFGVSPNHLQTIPVNVITNISFLTAEHIPLIEEMYSLGLAELNSRNIPFYAGKDLDSYVVAGFNYPVSVVHLHLHLCLPPYKHEKVFQYPRWHSMQKVLRDLREHGRVITYDEQPNDEEGNSLYAKIIKDHREALAWESETKQKH